MTPFRRPSWFRYVLLTALALPVLYPVLWMAASSLKSGTAIFSSPGLWPHPVRWSNYLHGWLAVSGFTFGHFILNSLLVSGLTVLGTVASAAVVAYGFARFDFPLKGLWFSLMLGTIMLPQEMIALPQYLEFARLGWVNTYLPIIVPAWLASVNGAFFVFLLMQFMRGVPRALDEAARLDGCNSLQFLAYVLLPVMQPALVTAAIFSFLWSWENFFTPLLYLDSIHLYTISLALNLFRDSSGVTSWGPLFAMSMLSLLPLFLLFFLAQGYVVEGIQTTGLKS